MTALTFYLLGAAPVIGWRDGPEFVETAAYLDIAHPSGFPLFSLLAKVNTWIPLGSLGFRVNVFDALAGAVSLVLLAFLIKTILNVPNGPPAPPAERRAQTFIILAITACLGLSSSFWDSTTEVEVYTLNLCFLALLLLCALKWSAGDGESLLMAGGFLYGLSLGNHAALVLYAPALFAYVFLGSPHRGEGWRRVLIRLGWLAFFFFLGLSVYVYLPLRALADPPLNFGDPHNWENFWFHISDRKDAETHFGTVKGVALFWSHLRRYFTQAVNPFYILFGLPLMIWGWLWLLKHKRAFAVAALTVILINSLFFIEWVDGSGLLPTYFLAFALTAAGLYRFWQLARESGLGVILLRPAFTALIVGTLIAFTALHGWGRLTDRYRNGAFLAVETFWEDQAGFPPGALVYDSALSFVSLAYVTIYQLRPDVTRIMMSSVATPQGFSPLRPSRYPLAVILPADPRIPDNTTYAREFTYANFDYDIPVFVELTSPTLSLFSNHLKPYGFFYYQVSTDKESMKNALLDGRLDQLATRWLAKLNREITQEKLLNTDRVIVYYVPQLLDLAALFRTLGKAGAAVELTQNVYQVMGPNGADVIADNIMLQVNMEMAMSLNGLLGRRREARSYLEANLALSPNNYQSMALLANSYRQDGDCEQALKIYQQAWTLRPPVRKLVAVPLDELTTRGWAECLNNQGRSEEARRLLAEEGFELDAASPEEAMLKQLSLDSHP